MSSINDALLATIAPEKTELIEQFKEPVLDNISNAENIVKKNTLLSSQVINEIQNILLNFKSHLSAFEIMQATNPDAYEALTQIIMVMISLSQIMIESGQLKDNSSSELETNQENISNPPEKIEDNKLSPTI